MHAGTSCSIIPTNRSSSSGIASECKEVKMEIVQCIRRVQEELRGGHFINETAVTNGAVMSILQALGWDIFDTRSVAPQYPVEGRRVDIALCYPPNKPIVFIEVKQAGREGGADRQLFEYAFHQGVPMVLLTNGQEWHIYLPAEQGSYQERQVYKLDLLERDPETIAKDLTRYLSYTNIVSGEALESARKDYKSVARVREIKRALPTAWHKLIEEQDSLLIDLLADKVESLCGYKPDLDAVADFLVTQVRAQDVPPESSARPLVSGAERSPTKSSESLTLVGNYGFRLKGQRAQARNAIDVLIQVLERLSIADPEFLERFASRPKHGRTRRFVAREKEELYPGRPDLARDHACQLNSGWWVGTNYSRSQIEQILRMAAEVARLRFGNDLVIWLG